MTPPAEIPCGAGGIEIAMSIGEKAVNKARILGIALLGAVLCVVTVACSGGVDKASQQDVKPFDVLATVRALEGEATLDPASVGGAFDADLRVDAGQSDDSFTTYLGTVRADAPASGVVDTVELRVPGKGNTVAKGPLVYLTLRQGRGPTMNDVVTVFGPATSADAMSPNAQKAFVLSYTTPRSQLRFGIGSPASRPVVSATIDRTGQ